MNDRCFLCGSTRPGRHYAFHYGRIASISSTHYSSIPETTTRFQLLGSKQIFICKHCVHQHVRQHALFWSAVGAGVAIIPAAFCRLLTAMNSPSGMSDYGILIVSISLILIVLGLSMIFSNVWMCLTGRCEDYAEQMAIEAMQKELETRERANVFWTNRQYSRLHAINLQD